MKGTSTTLAAPHLFNINSEDTPLSDVVLYPHLVAKLLYLAKQTCPDLLLAFSFLATFVQSPDEDDFKKLGCCLQYLSNTNILCSLGRHQVCILSGSGWLHPLLSIPIVTVIWVLSSQLERIYPMSSKQKLNTTTAELVGINDAMAMILWVYHFLETQGYNISHNVIFQDNESTMQLAKMDNILVANRPITLTFAIILLLMSYIGVRHRLHIVQLANFFTKGSLFRIFRKKWPMRRPQKLPFRFRTEEFRQPGS